jgi:predicted nucleic acid-binding protein
MSKRSVYLETTIPSLLAARPSKDVRMAGMQASARLWWEGKRTQFDLFVSPVVIAEARMGDGEIAGERLKLLAGIRELALTKEAVALAERLVRKMSLPESKQNDAFHVAIAASAGLDVLLTWNCRHLANVDMILKVEALCEQAGYRCPIICTTDELMN